ncbi:helix-turn-helix domain-containing protein [Paenibacillus cremeus]|uniref:helix-turn-helix domain-containing protein n=1 Tax=Paenibacillus cremeus TaxID=2163881 RepID=UPI0011AA8661|nr:helix-turn-helix domain-containing protein [Paenibacillus cremeus]
MKRRALRLRLKVIISAALMAIIPVILLGITTYLISSHSLMVEIGQANRDTMKQIQERIDSMLIGTDKIVLQHAYSPTLKDFTKLANPFENPQKFQDVMTILTSMEVLINDVDSVYLYLKNSSLIVSPSGGLTSADKLDSHVMEAISTATEPFFWLDRKSESTVPRGGSHVVTLIRAISDSSDKTSGYLIININERAFFKIIQNMQLGNREMIIITPSNHIFSDWNKHLLTNDFLAYPFIRNLIASEDAEKFGVERIRGENTEEDLMVNYIKSPYNDWKYISVIPYEVLTSPFRWIKQMIIAACCLLILISLAAAVGLSKRFSTIIANLLELMKSIGGSMPQPAKEMDEFGLIRHYAESFQTTKESLVRQVQESMPLLQANFIQTLLTSTLDASELQNKLEYYNIPTQYPCYSVLCIELDHLRGQTESDVNLFVYAAINITREIIRERADGVVVKTPDNHIAVIINHGNEKDHEQELQGEIFLISDQIREVIESLLHITATIGVGNYYYSAQKIHLAYREALEALQYQLVEGSGRVLFIGRVQPSSAVTVYPTQQEQSILNQIKLGNLDQICHFLDQFTCHLKKADPLNYEHVRQSFTQLIASSLRMVYELDPVSGPSLFSYNLYQRVHKCRTTEQIVLWLKREVYPPIVELINRRRMQRKHDTVEHVLEYIHLRYDSDLSLPLLAELVSMPVSHFSSMFKEEVGMTVSDYIIAFRMEKAKELLATSELKVSEIADRMRYNNSQNFIRMFKKVTGLTPGEYRLHESPLKDALEGMQ